MGSGTARALENRTPRSGLMIFKWAAAAAAALAFSGVAMAQEAPDKLTTPKEALGGHEPGEDYFLANYDQLSAYWKTLAEQSPRARLIVLGKTAEGRDQLMMVVSSPNNLRHLDRLKEIARRLGQAKGLTDDQAKALAAEGRAVVWIDAGLHASESINAQTHIQLVYDLLSKSDPETLRFLNDDLILLPIANPDGMQLVANWYMREPDPKKRQNRDLPVLYQKYIGHDDNRDFYASTQPETTNVNRALFREWFPQIVYNEHQTGPVGTVVFIPPFRDPFNYHYDPLVISELDGVSAAMHSRLIANDMPGSTSRSSAPYSTWFNGGLRTVGYFHNVIGILTEIIGDPTPMQLPLVPRTQLARQDEPYPVAPQTWHFRQSMDYVLQMDRAVLDWASRNRETLLYNYYQMGRNSIRRGSTDSWTITPKRIAALQAAAKAAPPAKVEGGATGLAGSDASEAVDAKLYETVLHAPDQRDARGYIIPADQPDLPTAIKFLNALMNTGVEVERAAAPFTVAGKSYPAGSFIVKADQAYRPHVLDMFEPQDHPQDFAYPGGPPNKPYDITGYTLALQMGVKFDRVLDGFDGPFVPVPDVIATPPAGRIVGSGQAGWIIDHAPNNGFILTNRLMKAHAPVFWVKGQIRAGERDFAPGALWIPASAAARAEVERAVKGLGLDAYAVDAAPAGETIALKPVRIGLVDVYGGSMPSGWMRWLFEQYEFPYQLVFPQRLNAGHLEQDYDVLVFADGIVPAPGVGRSGGGRVERPQPAPESIPAEYRNRLGAVTQTDTVPRLAEFAKAGGTVIAVGGSSLAGTAMGLPVENALVETGQDGKPHPLASTKFYIPGSLLFATVDNSQPLAFGLPRTMDVFFDSSPAFKVGDGARAVVGYQGQDVMHAGWAWGQKALDGTTAVVDADLGRGKVFLMGPEVTMRGQSNLSFKFLFNALYYGPAATKQP
jgi:hypothetical protein